MSKLQKYLPGVLCIFACLAVMYCFRFVYAAGHSMEPTCYPGDTVLVGRAFRDPRPGDVVLIQHNGQLVIKRVAAVAGNDAFAPGDAGKEDGATTVHVRLTDPVQLAQSHAALWPDETDCWTFYHYWNSLENTTVPAGYIFVVGDNPEVSNDSRNPAFGLVPTDEVWGYVLWIS